MARPLRTPGKPITDVIFDFGNVLIYWDPVAVLIPRYSQKTIDEFLDNDISGFYDVNDLMDGGTSTDEAIAIMRRDKGDKWADILDYYHQELPRLPGPASCQGRGCSAMSRT